MTEKRFNVFDVDGTVFLEDHKEGSYHIGEKENVDIHCLNDIADRLNTYAEENEQLKSILKIYHKVANCRNCHYHDYDTLFGGYDDYEICNKGNDVSDGICSEWREH